MLHLQSLQTADGLPPPDAPRPGGGGDLVDAALGFLLRQYLVILLLALVGGLAGAGFLIVRPPTYTAHAKIFSGTQRLHLIQEQSLFADSPLDQVQMESQLQILQSRAVLARVVQKLKLANDPEFGNPPGGLIQRVFHFFTQLRSEGPKLD